MHDNGIKIDITDHVTERMEWVSSVAIHGSRDPQKSNSITITHYTRTNKDDEYIKELSREEGAVDSLSLRSLFVAARRTRKTARVLTHTHC